MTCECRVEMHRSVKCSNEAFWAVRWTYKWWGFTRAKTLFVCGECHRMNGSVLLGSLSPHPTARRYNDFDSLVGSGVGL